MTAIHGAFQAVDATDAADLQECETRYSSSKATGQRRHPPPDVVRGRRPRSGKVDGRTGGGLKERGKAVTHARNWGVTRLRGNYGHRTGEIKWGGGPKKGWKGDSPGGYWRSQNRIARLRFGVK